MNFPKNTQELKDFLSFVVLYGPDDFPTWRNMNIEKAFIEIESSLDVIAGQINSAERLGRIVTLLRKSKEEYASGKIKEGAHLLQDAMNLL